MQHLKSILFENILDFVVFDMEAALKMKEEFIAKEQVAEIVAEPGTV